MDPRRYLKRIGAVGDFAADTKNLQLLQRGHMLSVAFENIDIYFGIPVEFSVESFYRKIVTRRRGGYCYELNGLFHWLLLSLGYDAFLVSCLVHDKKGFITEFEHMAIIVDVEGNKLLVDVGFGDSSLSPVLLEPGKIQHDGLNEYRIVDDVIVDGKRSFGLEKFSRQTSAFAVQYYFTLERRTLDYYIMMHEFQEVVPAAHYKRSLICSRPTDDGRISIINNRLIETRDRLKKVSVIESMAERDRLLGELFGIEVPHIPAIGSRRMGIGEQKTRSQIATSRIS